MTLPILYVAITNHGFGHATRTAAIVDTLRRRCPEMVIILVTTAPRWLLESYIEGEFILRPWGFDVGVVQGDSLTMDKAATLEKWRQIRQEARSYIAAEVNFIRQNRVGLVLADIPPLATAIAHTAGVPCWMVSNFGWDFIYRAWGEEFIELADWIADYFAQCDRLFRLPFHEAMSAFPTITDVGLVGGSPRYEAAVLRDKFGITAPKDRTILLTFGGLGLEQIPYHNLERFPDWQFITFDRQAPALPNLRQITDHHYRPVDVMPLCSRVVSKPGFSTFSEACRLDLPIISITRDDFAESPILLSGMMDCAYHQVLEVDTFVHGDWQFLHEPLHPPRSSQPVLKNGNEAIAQAILDYFQVT